MNPQNQVIKVGKISPAADRFAGQVSKKDAEEILREKLRGAGFSDAVIGQACSLLSEGMTREEAEAFARALYLTLQIASVDAPQFVSATAHSCPGK